MTTCCGWLTANRGCWLATDSLMTIGDHRATVASKIIERGGIAVAISGPALLFDVVAFALGEVFGRSRRRRTVPVAAFLEAVRADCNARGWTAMTNEGRPEYRNVELLATDGRQLFNVDGYFRANVVGVNEFTAIGVGEYAYGAAYAWLGYAGRTLNKLLPDEVLRVAVEATTRYSIYVGGEPIVRLVPRSTGWRFAAPLKARRK